MVLLSGKTFRLFVTIPRPEWPLRAECDKSGFVELPCYLEDRVLADAGGKVVKVALDICIILDHVKEQEVCPSFWFFGCNKGKSFETMSKRCQCVVQLFEVLLMIPCTLLTFQLRVGHPMDGDNVKTGNASEAVDHNRQVRRTIRFQNGEVFADGACAIPDEMVGLVEVLVVRNFPKEIIEGFLRNISIQQDRMAKMYIPRAHAECAGPKGGAFHLQQPSVCMPSPYASRQELCRVGRHRGWMGQTPVSRYRFLQCGEPSRFLGTCPHNRLGSSRLHGEARGHLDRDPSSSFPGRIA